MKFYSNLIAIALMCITITSQAQLAGKNIILVHGFSPEQLLNPPEDHGLSGSKDYWDTFDAALTNPATSKILHYPSSVGIQGANGIASILSAQLETLLNAGHCDNQCIVITHSTGDLVMRYIMANKYSLLGHDLASRFKVIAFIDMAGAGGGTELANLAVDAISGVNQGGDIFETLVEWFGFEINVGINPGVAYDLQPSVARNTAVNNIPAIPKIRIASTGDEVYGFLTHFIIKGRDDSVVPLHSSCGAAFDGGFDSCTQDLRMDGAMTEVNDAPSSSQLYNYHYPLILSEDMPHNDMQADENGYDMTIALSSERRYNDSGINPLSVKIDYYETDNWWNFFYDYRYITNADDKNMGQIILDSFE